jgi:hypothetical protein
MGKSLSFFYSVRDRTAGLFKLFYSNWVRNSNVLISLRKLREREVRLLAQDPTPTFDIVMVFMSSFCVIMELFRQYGVSNITYIGKNHSKNLFKRGLFLFSFFRNDGFFTYLIFLLLIVPKCPLYETEQTVE